MQNIKGRPIGKKTSYNNYNLYFLNLNNKNFELIGEFKTIPDIEDYLNDNNLSISGQVLQRILHNKTSSKANFLKIEKIQ